MRASLGLVGLVLVLAASLRGAHGAPGSIPAVYALLDRVLPANTSSLFQLQLTADLTVRFLHSATLPVSSQVMNEWLGQPPPRAHFPPPVCWHSTYARLYVWGGGERREKGSPDRQSLLRVLTKSNQSVCLFCQQRRSHHVPPAPCHCLSTVHTIHLSS